MKVGLITTLGTNVGDDFIREGIVHALKCAFPGEPFEFVPVNKHEPATLYPPWHPVGWGRFFPTHFTRSAATEVLSRLFSRLGGSRFDGCDAIIQCGAPVFFYRCWFTEWSNPVWRHVVGRLSDKIPVLNLAAGSCYPWERLPERIEDPRERRFIEDILAYCVVTTFRDKLAEKVVVPLAGGARYERIPCSAFLAPLAHRPPANDLGDGDKHVMINYMAGAGHYDYGLKVDHQEWERTVVDLVELLRGRHKVAFICHNDGERRLAESLAPGVPVFLPSSIGDYFRIASTAKAGVFNRMHACMGFAGLGIPSIGVGVDSRMLMVQEIGLPTVYVKDADATRLAGEVERLLGMAEGERRRLLALQEETLARYAGWLADALGKK